MIFSVFLGGLTVGFFGGAVVSSMFRTPAEPKAVDTPRPRQEVKGNGNVQVAGDVTLPKN